MIQPTPPSDVPQTIRETSRPRFDTLTYPDRTQEILELRRIANCAAGQMAPDTSAVELFEPRDFEASHVVAEVDGQLVGTIRLAPPLQGFILNHANPWPGPISGLPKSSECLETAWAVIHPSYQGRGLLWQLAAHMVLTAKQSNKPFLIGGANPSMWRFWQRCGYRKTGTSYASRNDPEVQGAVILLEVDAVIAGRGIAPQLARALAPLLTSPSPKQSVARFSNYERASGTILYV